MKNIRLLPYSMLLLLAVVFTTSCDKILDDPLENEIIAGDTDYSQSADMILLVRGAYNELYNMQWETVPLIGIRGDDIDVGGLGDQPLLANIDSFRYDRNAWLLNSTWLNLYTDLIYFQGAIEEIQKYQDAGANAETAQQYIAEVKVMQGFEMLQLARMWGSILIPTSSAPSDLFNVELTNFNGVMEHISNLMDEAIPSLPDSRPNQRTDIRGGVTRHTALAIQAMANLEAGNYQAVADATGQIISSGMYSLSDDFYQLFKIPGKLNNENLLEYQYSDFGTATGTSNRFPWDFYGPGSWTPARAGAGQGWGFYEPSQKFIKFMLDRGETNRLETTVLFTPRGIEALQSDPEYAELPEFVDNTTREGDVFNNHPRYLFLSGKHYLPSTQLTQGRTAYGENKNMIVIRYAEILLMHAEALVSGASNSTMTADEAVNMVRSRANLTAISNVTLANVLDEKMAEFGAEWGVRFYDVVRHGQTEELSYGGRRYNPSTHRFYPYPLEQINLLPQLQGATQE
ncbi:MULTISPECIES: RagB/SusD family nutrient uptake outer membrane protein [Sphingobacterium]|uniref:RagB/SusD family nutrient uptake outer membrane protein n=1 Tax=Sphingobacterium populi TaxID=1812824 RepID=A0ABW5UF39_9SPHI|nr:RagB/SusD family nutrient uptake outer membrane protein [Sphingobacterium sp. CFCC 11742]